MRTRAALLATLLVVASCSTDEPNAASNDPAATTSTAAPASREAREDHSGGSGGRRQDATLTGRIVDRQGAPLAGLPVVVLRDRSGGGFSATFTAIFSLGIACVASPGICRGSAKPAASGTTDGDGRYSLTLHDAYRPGYETDDDWTLQVGRAPRDGEVTGPSSSFELEVNTKVQEAPDLLLWDATPTIAGGDVLQVAIAPVTADAALGGGAPQFVDERGDVVWTLHGRTLDARVLEDTTTRVVGSARADLTVRHRDGRTIYHQAVTTPAIARVGTAVPTSRARPCTTTDGGLVGCPFTDGDLALQRAPELATGASATVDLGEPAEIGLVVVRGEGSNLRDDTRVEGSSDGRTWTELPHRELTGAAGWSAGPAPGHGIPSFRFVRVSGPRQLAEISVWPPTPADRAAARPSSGTGPGGGGDGAGKGLAAGVALALVVAVGAGGVALRRRGRRA